MANAWAGEVPVVVNGELRVAKLTLGALVELEANLASGSLLELAERFEAGRYAAKDVLYLLLAGLRGGGWEGNINDLAIAEIAGGPMGAVKVAAELLARAFTLPEGNQ